jgi:hypothetical protein
MANPEIGRIDAGSSLVHKYKAFLALSNPALL